MSSWGFLAQREQNSLKVYDVKLEANEWSWVAVPPHQQQKLNPEDIEIISLPPSPRTVPEEFDASQKLHSLPQVAIKAEITANADSIYDRVTSSPTSFIFLEKNISMSSLKHVEAFSLLDSDEVELTMKSCPSPIPQHDEQNTSYRISALQKLRDQKIRPSAAFPVMLPLSSLSTFESIFFGEDKTGEDEDDDRWLRMVSICSTIFVATYGTFVFIKTGIALNRIIWEVKFTFITVDY